MEGRIAHVFVQICACTQNAQRIGANESPLIGRVESLSLRPVFYRSGDRRASGGCHRRTADRQAAVARRAGHLLIRDRRTRAGSNDGGFREALVDVLEQDGAFRLVQVRGVRARESFVQNILNRELDLCAGLGLLPPVEDERLRASAALVSKFEQSDVFEIDRPDGSMWQFDEFLKYVADTAAGDAPVMDPILTHVRAMHGSDLLADDFSFVEARF